MTGAELLVSSLEISGVEIVFGIPGLHTLDVYDRLLDSPIRHVTARHEQGAAYMADGYARKTGRTGVVLTITGPGLTNALTAAAEAYHDAVPMLLISSQVPRSFLSRGRGFLHEVRDSEQMVRGVVKESIRSDTPSDIPGALYRAIRMTGEGRPGPVHLEIPLDLFGEEAAQWSADAVPHPPGKPSGKERARDAAGMLESASRPLIIAGGGARKAAEEVRELAEALGAPVVTTAAGKGVLPEDHPLSLGCRLHLPSVRRVFDESDVLLAVGTQLSVTDFWDDDPRYGGRVIQVDLDPANFGRNLPCHLGIVADAAEGLRSIIAGIGRRKGGEERTVLVKAAVDAARNEMPVVVGRPDGLSRELEVIGAIRAAVPPDVPLYADMTTLAYVALSEYPSLEPGTFFHPAGFGTLGWALPAAAGGALGCRKPTVALLGDGGLQFTLPELAVLAQEGIPVTVLVWNNRGYGEIRQEEERRHPGRRIAVDVEGPDLVTLGRAYGIPALSAGSREDIEGAIVEALGRGGPAIIEICP